MHTAYAPSTRSVLEHGTQVTALASLPEDGVLVGTAAGQLLRVVQPKDLSVALTKKAIEQLLAIPSLDLLLVLSDGNVSTFSLASFKEREPLVLPAKANILVADESDGTVRLAIGCRRRLWIGTWEQGGWVQPTVSYACCFPAL
jgi:hypothetical protein